MKNDIFISKCEVSLNKEDMMVDEKSNKPEYDLRLFLFKVKWVSSACLDKYQGTENVNMIKDIVRMTE